MDHEQMENTPENLAWSRGTSLAFNDRTEVQVGNVSTTITEEQPKDISEELHKNSDGTSPTCRCMLQ
jgi:hypothetical protein